MASPFKDDALEGFQRLSPNVWLLERGRPSRINSGAESANGGVQSPSTIVLLTWMNASLRNTARYIKGYTKVYPTAHILLVTNTNIDIQFRSDAKQQKRIAPAMEVLRGDTEKRLLVHLFSNGGAQQTCQLARLYRKVTGGELLPVQAMVLDSGPGLSRIKQGVAAMTVGLPKMWILRMMGILLTYISLTLLVVLARIRGTDVISRSRDSLNDIELMDGNMSRCYIYSLADPMVAWQDVVSHAEEAEEKGWRVVTEKYVDSGHVAHLRQDEDRYWGAVKSLWASSKS